MAVDVAKRGRGIIRISNVPELLEGLGNPEAPEEWHKALLLPEHYVVESARPRIIPGALDGTEIVLVVESEAIPLSERPIDDTVVMPCYYRYESGTVQLTCIDINQWDGEYWKTKHTEMFMETNVSEEKQHAE